MDIEWILRLRDEASARLQNIQKMLAKFKQSLTDASAVSDEVTKSVSYTSNEINDMGVNLYKTQGAIAGTADNLKDLENEQKKTSESMGEFKGMLKEVRFGFLSMGFVGMQLARGFGFLNDKIMETYFAGELMNIQLTMIWSAAPMMQPLVDAFYALADIFYALPEPVQGFMGVLFPLLSVFGSIISQIGFFVFGFAGIATVFAALTTVGSPLLLLLGNIVTVLLAFAGPILLVIGIIVALWLAWQSNFANIRQTAMEIWNAIKSVFEGIWEIIEGFFEFFTGIVELDGDKIVRGIAKICEGMKKIFIDGLGGILIAVVKFVANVIIEFIKWGDKLLGILGTAFVGLLKSFADWFANVIKGAWDFGVNFVKAIVNGIISVGSTIGNAIWNVIPEPFKSWIQGAAGFVGGIATGIGNLAGQIGNMLGFQDVIWRAGQKPIRISPQDNIIATKGDQGQSLNFAPTINISANLNYPTDADALGRRIMDSMYTELKRRTM